MSSIEDLKAFRVAVRGWIADNLPARLAGRPGLVWEQIGHGAKPTGDVALWAERVASRGWGVPDWPRRYGGADLDPAETSVLAAEFEQAGTVNPINSMGVRMFGPTLLEFGDDAQKARHLPGIADASVRWCQGYSEPGAGSDLAALTTSCEDAGDHWRVRGQKVWTSGAQYADWCFCLVRTDPARKHEGISFVLLDMRQRGVTVRPIQLISGESPFCEVFFDDARVEKDDMVGPLNGGWSVAKRLLQFERANQSEGRAPAATSSLADLASRYVGRDARGRIADADLRSRLVAHLMEERVHALTLERVRRETNGGRNPTSTTSVMKNSGTRLVQASAELAIEILGIQSLGWRGDGFTSDELAATRDWLLYKANTIYGGSQEIQNSIIAKQILGLPAR